MTTDPGATSTFTDSGALPADYTYPRPALVMVISPNSVASPAALFSGSCVAQGRAGSMESFQVKSVAMAVNPTSVTGRQRGMYLAVTDTATFHLAANGPGGTIHFSYTVNNGRGSNPVSITVAAGQTTATYSFTWSGNLPADHTAPENGGVIVQSPNAVNSPLLAPAARPGTPCVQSAAE